MARQCATPAGSAKQTGTRSAAAPVEGPDPPPAAHAAGASPATRPSVITSVSMRARRGPRKLHFPSTRPRRMRRCEQPVLGVCGFHRPSGPVYTSPKLPEEGSYLDSPSTLTLKSALTFSFVSPWTSRPAGFAAMSPSWDRHPGCPIELRLGRIRGAHLA